MAPHSSSDVSQARHGSGLCRSPSIAPTPPASGLGFDTRPHLQRLLQSSASPSEDTSFHIQQQSRHFYMERRPPLEDTLELSRTSSNADITMVADLPKDPTQQRYPLQLYFHGGAGGSAILPSLMRYHSAPSCVLDGLAGMGNSIISSNPELDQFLSSNVVAEMKDVLMTSESSHDPPHNCIDNPGMARASVDKIGSHGNGGQVHPQSPYQQGCGGALLSRMNMHADDVPPICSPDGLPEVRKAALHSPPNYGQESAFMHSNTYLANGNGASYSANGNGAPHGVSSTNDGLLRHDSSPAGLLSQMNDEHERHMMASSSGNSSEEGSYERQGGGCFLSSYQWDDSGIMTGPSDVSLVARKRSLDVTEKGYLGSTRMDSQKADTFECSTIGNFSGFSTTSSTEPAYFAARVSPDSTPCRARARRGFATHPRSIAERVRRTKISERMKRLQELVPKIDKQANIAEMLDEAVEYVKQLQHQVQELKENQMKCNCACAKPKETPSK